MALQGRPARVREPRGQVDAAESGEVPANARVHGCEPAALGKDVDRPRTGARADRDLRCRARLGRGAEHSPAPRQRPDQVELLAHRRLRVIGHQHHRVPVEEAVHPARCLDERQQRAVGVGDRVLGGLGPVAMRVVVVVGEGEEQEVVEVVPREIAPDAGRVLVASARARERRLARHLPAGVELAVEQLVGAPHRVAEAGGQRDAAQNALQPDLVPATTAVDEEWRAGRPHARVSEPFEHRLDVRRKVRHVHVVDDVVERSDQPEGAGRLERGPVLDVAALDPVIPVDGADSVLVRSPARGHLRAGDRGHGWKGRDAVVHQRPALQERPEGRRGSRRDRALEHVDAQGVDHDEDELARCPRPRGAHRSDRRPSYLRRERERRARAR